MTSALTHVLLKVCYLFCNVEVLILILKAVALKVPGPISQNVHLIQMMRHHPINIGFKFQLNRLK